MQQIKKYQEFLLQHLNHRIKEFFKIAFVLVLIGACSRAKEKSEFFYKDYDLKKGAGIDNISISERDELIKSKTSFFKMIYSKKEIDSIYFIDMSNGYSSIVSIKKYKNDSVVVYKFSWPIELYGNVYEYLVYTPLGIKDYSFPTPVVSGNNTLECKIINTQIYNSISQMCSIKQKDTLNFINSLLSGKEIPVVGISEKKERRSPKYESLTLLKYFEFNLSEPD